MLLVWSVITSNILWGAVNKLGFGWIHGFFLNLLSRSPPFSIRMQCLITRPVLSLIVTAGRKLTSGRLLRRTGLTWFFKLQHHAWSLGLSGSFCLHPIRLRTIWGGKSISAEDNNRKNISTSPRKARLPPRVKFFIWLWKLKSNA